MQWHGERAKNGLETSPCHGKRPRRFVLDVQRLLLYKASHRRVGHSREQLVHPTVPAE